MAVFEIFKSYGKLAGIKKDLKPHMGRVFFITEGLKTVSVGEMVRTVGHSTSVITHEYDKSSNGNIFKKRVDIWKGTVRL